MTELMTDKLLQEFTTHLLDKGRSRLTVSGYQRAIEHFLRWFEQTNEKNFLLNEVTPADIHAYCQFMLTKQSKANTINYKLVALSALMKWAVQTGLAESDPTKQMPNFRPSSEYIPKYLDKNAQNALLRAVEEDLRLSRIRYPKRWVARQRDASMVIFIMQTGLKMEETLALRLSDLHLGERKGSVLVRHEKGSKQRTVPLNTGARKAIEDWLKVRPEIDTDYVWVALESDSKSDSIRSLSSRGVQRSILRLGQDAGLNNLTPTMLRNTFTKNLVDSGVSLEKVAALLGHINLNTTRIYYTSSLNDLEKAVEMPLKKRKQ